MCDLSDVEGVAIQCFSTRRKKIIVVVFVRVRLDNLFSGLGLFFLAQHYYRVQFALAHRHHLFFGDGAAALRFGCAFCRRFNRNGKIIVVGVAACRRPRYVVIVDVRIFVVVFSIVVATRVAFVRVMRFDFVTVTSIAVVASIFFILAVFFSRPFLRCRSTVVTVMSPLAIASTVAVSAFRLLSEIASCASHAVMP